MQILGGACVDLRRAPLATFTIAEVRVPRHIEARAQLLPPEGEAGKGTGAWGPRAWGLFALGLGAQGWAPRRGGGVPNGKRLGRPYAKGTVADIAM